MAASSVRALNCPNCGAQLELHGMGYTLSVACGSCRSLIDAKDPGLRILQQFHDAPVVYPLIPLGKRGQWNGVQWEVIGFQQRSVTAEGVAYPWREYVLFNPYKGFRYLTEYNGHWTFVKPIPEVPKRTTLGGRPALQYKGLTYRHFTSAEATTDYVIGEFPWRVQVGDKVAAKDYIAPPWMLSAEVSELEVTWSQAQYIDGKELWKAFSLPGSPPKPLGVFACQPAVALKKARSLTVWWLVFLMLLVTMWVGTNVLCADKEVFRQKYVLHWPTQGENSYVTSEFLLEGRPSTVDIRIETDLTNDWAYFSMALINASTGDAYDFGREVSYYSGVDSDGSWSEGSQSDGARLGSIPAGRYYLRVEPEMDSTSPARRTMNYQIVVRRDVPAQWVFFVAMILLTIPLGFAWTRALAAEGLRWQESDYGASVSSGSTDDE